MRASSRLVSLIAKVKNLDETSARGERTFANGIATAEGKLMLEGFNFNKAANLDSVLKAHYVLDTATGTLTLPAFHPAEDVQIPASATHLAIGYACGGLMPETFKSETVYAERVVIPVSQEAGDTELKLPSLPAQAAVTIHFILIEFLQEINSSLYLLKNEGVQRAADCEGGVTMEQGSNRTL